MASIPIFVEDGLHSEKSNQGNNSIVDDFMYKNNVASADVYIRMGFLRKVYGILSLQLFFTVLITGVCMFTHEISLYISNNRWMLIVAMISSVVILIAMMIKRRETPTNFILLAAFTVVQSYSLSVVVTFYQNFIVLEAFALTFVVTAGLTGYTFQTKRDFSSWGAGLFSVLWILFFAGIFQLFFFNTYTELLLSIGGAVVFSLFIVYDTHMIINRLSAEEYIIASIELYLDIINLFLYILRILNATRRN